MSRTRAGPAGRRLDLDAGHLANAGMIYVV